MSNSDLFIREAEEIDAADIYRLNKTALGYDYDLAKTKLRLRSVLADKHNRVAVAVIDGCVAGYIHGAAYDCVYTDSLKDILALAVDDEYRHCRVGSALLAYIENWAIEDGCVGVRLVSGIEREGAHRFYEACGYYNRKNQKNFIKLFNRYA